MNDFKSVFDALNAANAEVTAKAVEIEDLFKAGEVEQALAKEPELDEATAKADQLEGLYNKIVAASRRDVEAIFVPASEEANEKDEPKTISRAEFDALSLHEQASFDGVVVDEKE
jgi:ATP-dependent Lon protease